MRTTDARQVGWEPAVAWEHGEPPAVGWEGLTVAKADNPESPWATVVADDGGAKVVVMPWEFWRSDVPVKSVKRVGLVVYVPNKR